MRLNEDQYTVLGDRIDAALKASTFAAAMEAIGDFIKVDVDPLPGLLRAKFKRLLDRLALLTFSQ
jgi:hypothetical protein